MTLSTTESVTVVIFKFKVSNLVLEQVSSAGMIIEMNIVAAWPNKIQLYLDSLSTL